MGAKSQDIVRGGVRRGELLAAGGGIERGGMDRGEFLGVQLITAAPTCRRGGR